MSHTHPLRRPTSSSVNPSPLSPGTSSLGHVHTSSADPYATNEFERWYPLPLSVLHVASTTLVARIGYCRFPSEIRPSLNFPLLKQLTLELVSISEEVLHAVLSVCHVLESLFLQEICDVGRLRVTTSVLRNKTHA
jgi:hypothetical protein